MPAASLARVFTKGLFLLEIPLGFLYRPCPARLALAQAPHLSVQIFCHCHHLSQDDPPDVEEIDCYSSPEIECGEVFVCEGIRILILFSGCPA